MAEKLLTIGVNLAGEDQDKKKEEFILVMVNGVEGISMPYSYDVKLFRKKDKRDISPQEIINTAATIEINRVEDKNVPFIRTGVFEHFEKAGRGTKDDEFRVYTAKIVPAFKMLESEVLFRVFENQDVVTILDQVLKGVPNLSIDLRPLRAGGVTFPKMEYCVQFGESTFAFLSRLMARFGIYYFFDSKFFLGGEPQNETMMFAIDGSNINLGCLEDEVDIVADKEASDEADEKTRVRVFNFVQRFDPRMRSSTAGNFNVLAPTKPFIAERKIEPGFDLAKDTPGPAHDFLQEEFPAPFDNKDEASAYVRTRQKQEEQRVATIAGRSGNRTFIPGRTILIRKDAIHVAKDDTTPEHSLEGTNFLLEWVGFSALEPFDNKKVWETVGDFVLDVLFKGTPAAEITGGIVDSLLSDYLGSLMEFELGEQEEAPALAPALLGSAVAGGAGALAGGLIPAIVKLVNPENKTRFSNAFVATLRSERVPPKLPRTGPRPNAYGPHLATVIGDDGTDTAKGDISADAFGRVRVRFPWDLGPRREGISDDPFATGKNTCWLRVAQSWAGRNFGTQFLPRIGHEVVVEFIDGDPERPIIIGSVYNADLGKPNLPFAAFKDGPKDFGEKDLLGHTGLGSFQRSGVKTQITPASKAKQGFHMLRFDDTRDSEQVLVRSQGRYDLTAFRHHFDTTHGSRHILVKGGKDDKGNTLGGSSFTTTGGEYDLHVGGDRYEGIEKIANLTVKADVVHDLQTTSQTMVGTTASLNALKIILEAQAKITLKVGGSFVVIDPCGVYISGPMVQINSGGAADSTTDASVTDPADATQADPGEPPNFLDLQPKGGGGGGSRKRTVKAKHGFVCKMNTDGTIQVTKGIKVNAKDPNYASAVVADLSLMNSTKNGKALIDSLDSSGKSVTIRPLVPAPTPSNAFATPTNGTAAANGTGSDSTVDYNPGDWPDPTTRTKPPGDVILFHELTHADHNAKGTNAQSTTRTDNFHNDEEFNTIGPENEYRDERGVHRRTDHHDL